MAVTSPLLLTVATPLLLVVQVTLCEAVPGDTVAVSCRVPPTCRVAVDGLTLTLVARGALTVTVHVRVM